MARIIRSYLLAQVKNTAFGSVVSQYDYVNDALGRRTEISRSGTRMSESRTDAYGYNDRNELTNTVKNATLNEYAYQYDDIGNRITSLNLGTNRVYSANKLNQYSSITTLTSDVGLQTSGVSSAEFWVGVYSDETIYLRRKITWNLCDCEDGDFYQDGEWSRTSGKGLGVR